MLASQQTLAAVAVSLPRSRRSAVSARAAAARPRLDRQRGVVVRAQKEEDTQSLVEATAAMQTMGVPLLTVRARAVLHQRCSSA